MSTHFPEQDQPSVATAHMLQLGGTFERTFHPRAYLVPRPEIQPPLSEFDAGVGYFIVKRFVERDDRDIFANTDIEQIVGTYQADGHPPSRMGLSLVSIRDARRIRTRYRNDSDESLLKRYETPVTKLPDTRFCRPKGVEIFGALDVGADSYKHVVLTLDTRSEKRLRKERLSILSAVGVKRLDYDETPHLTVFKTRSMAAAEELKAELEGAIQSHLPVIFAKPTPKEIV